jgi:DNA repair exonuclease SbcCD nuclease subunit
VAELQAKGYQYWALGHVHEPWIQRGDVTLAYPGNLQGRHIRELGARGALLVSAEEGEITDVERVEVDVLRWHLLEVDVSQAADRAAAVRLAGQSLSELLQASPAGLPLATRVVFSGRSPAHLDLVADEGQLRQEVIAQALALNPDRLWVEKVKVTAEPVPQEGAAADDESLDALTELQGLALAAPEDEEFVSALQGDWQALLEKMPSEVLHASPELKALSERGAAQVAERVREAMPLVMARVVARAGRDARDGA